MNKDSENVESSGQLNFLSGLEIITRAGLRAVLAPVQPRCGLQVGGLLRALTCLVCGSPSLNTPATSISQLSSEGQNTSGGPKVLEMPLEV